MQKKVLLLIWGDSNLLNVEGNHAQTNRKPTSQTGKDDNGKDS
jgi:hypothetical protein